MGRFLPICFVKGKYIVRKVNNEKMFLEKLKEDERFLGESYIDTGLRVLEWIYVGSNIHLSIQASRMHYCHPRETVDLDDYTHFELALIVNGKISCDTGKIKEFPQYEKLMEYKDTSIFPYVPKELLSELYCWCLEYFNNEKGM